MNLQCFAPLSFFHSSVDVVGVVELVVVGIFY